MHFDIDDLNSRIIKLQGLMNSTLNDIEKLELSRDIKLLKLMVNYVSNDRYYVESMDLPFTKQMDKRNNELVNFFNKNSKLLYRSLYGYSFGMKLPWKFTLDKKISNCDYEKLLIDFLSVFDTRLLDIYESLKESKRIEINPKKYNIFSDALGLNVHLITSDESFILSRFNNKMSRASIIPHELGHAFIHNKTNNIDSFVRKNGSLFSEAYSIFLEMIFYDYLKNTIYFKNARSSEYNKLDSFLGISECFNSIILSFDKLTTRDGKIYLDDSSVADIYSSTLVFSNLLAMYLVNLYRNDKCKFMIKINEFFDMFGYASDEEILSYFKLEDMIYGTNSVLNEYIKTYRK